VYGLLYIIIQKM